MLSAYRKDVSMLFYSHKNKNKKKYLISNEIYFNLNFLKHKIFLLGLKANNS